VKFWAVKRYRSKKDPNQIDIDPEVTAEAQRLLEISRKLDGIEPAVQDQVFARLLAVDDETRAKPETYWKSLRLSVFFPALAAFAAVAAWHFRHGAWPWLNSHWHWTILGLIASLIAVLVVWFVFSGISSLGVIPGKLVAIVGFITAVVALLFTLYPNLRPTTEESLTISQLSLERHATLEQYANEPEISAAIAATVGGDEQAAVERFLALNKPFHQYRYGTVVNFHVEEKGLRKKKISFRWSLFDAFHREAIANAEKRDPWCIFNRTLKSQSLPRAHTSPSCATYEGNLNADEGSFAVWVNARGVKDGYKRAVSCFFVRIDGYYEGNRLAYVDSPNFPTMSSKNSKSCVKPKSPKSKKAAKSKKARAA
jgi:hypothetical protein